MNKTRRMRLLQTTLALLAAGAVPAVVQAQTAPTAARPTAEEAQTLAKYDKNNNGVLDADEAAAMRADTSAAATAAAASGEVVEMSPFTVSSEKDVGYYAENTLAGSRLKTNLSDLGASISVVTKQQLEDTGALDLNDVFMYEANTEGANTYTPVQINRGNVVDSIGGWSSDTGSAFTSSTANRVRGLGAADTAQNNYPTVARMPFDNYNSNSVEISRGPNSMLFGTGSPAGIVNQSTAEAVIGQQHTTVTARYGTNDAWRASIGTNVPIGEKFAVYVAGLYDERGFARKPSYDTYRRQYASAAWRPFKTTKITASYEHYDNKNNRPNYLPPQDYVTPWRNAGRPGWNPVTQMVTFQDTGVTVGPYITSTRDERYIPGVTPSVAGDLTDISSSGVAGPYYVGGIGYLANRQALVYDNASLVNFTVTDATAGGNTTNGLPAAANRDQQQLEIAARRLTSSVGFRTPQPDPSTGATGYAQWLPLHVTNKGIYDWEKYNLFGANYGTQNGYTYNVELQQQIFSTPLHNMHFSGGWFRQEFEEWTHYGLGQSNQAPRLYVDTNLYTIDGKVNPYFGSPFVLDSQADSFYRPETNDNMRAMLAYEIDMTQRSNWMRWLGRHRVLGLVSQQDQWSNNLRYRLSYDSGDPRFLPNQNPATANNFSWAGNAASIQRFYYVGHSNDGTVTQGVQAPLNPGFGGANVSSLTYYNWTDKAFRQTTMGYDMNLLYSGGNYGVSTRKTTSKSFAYQGWLWNERILPTFGWRTDELKLQSYAGRNYDGTAFTTPQQYTNGFGNPGMWNILGNATYFKGDTTTKGGVIRPLKGWKGIEDRAASGNFFAQLARGFSFHYNESDNFNAPTGILVDFFNRRLSAPSGKGKDYGFGVSLFDDKLVFRMNWYEATNQNAVSATASTTVGRLQRIDTNDAHRWAEFVVRMRHGQDPTTDLEFANNSANPLTPQQETEIADLQFGTSFPLRAFNWPAAYDGQTTATENNESKGKEISATYNPTRAWTMKLTVGQQKAGYTKVGPEVQEWINYRKPQWENLKSEYTTELTKADGSKLQLGTFWEGYGFTAGSAFNDAPSNATGGTGNIRSTYTSVVDAVYLPALAQQGTSSSNLREWTASYLTSYTFQTGRLKGLSVGGSVRWQDKAKAGYYALLDPDTYARPNSTTANITFPDLSRPIYVPSETNVDLWASYSMKLTDKIRMKIQLNVRDVTEDGGLQPIAYNVDGSEAQYRIKEPRTWFLTTTFDF